MNFYGNTKRFKKKRKVYIRWNEALFAFLNLIFMNTCIHIYIYILPSACSHSSFLLFRKKRYLSKQDLDIIDSLKSEFYYHFNLPDHNHEKHLFFLGCPRNIFTLDQQDRYAAVWARFIVYKSMRVCLFLVLIL